MISVCDGVVEDVVGGLVKNEPSVFCPGSFLFFFELAEDTLWESFRFLVVDEVLDIPVRVDGILLGADVPASGAAEGVSVDDDGERSFGVEEGSLGDPIRDVPSGFFPNHEESRVCLPENSSQFRAAIRGNTGEPGDCRSASLSFTVSPDSSIISS